MRYVAPPLGVLVQTRLDAFDACYDRRSGQTHLLVEPAPQILAALTQPLTAAELVAALAASFDLAGDAEALDARLGELVEAGLIETS